MPNDQYTPPHTLRADRVNVLFDGEPKQLPIYRRMGGSAWAQDTPTNEMSCVRTSLLSLYAWDRLATEFGAKRPFRGPVLAVVDEQLVLARGDWWQEQDPEGQVVGRIERRARRRHAVLTADISEAVNA